MLKKNPLFKVKTVLLSSVLLLSLLQPITTSAQTPFVIGGVVSFSYPCPCSGNFLVTVLGPNPGSFSYYPGTQAFLNFNLPRPGTFIVGSYTPGTGVCLIPVVVGCVPGGFPIGTINPMTGTSL